MIHLKRLPAFPVGDMLLFAGTDTSRACADYVGHVELMYAISGSTVTMAGHGSGTPSSWGEKRYLCMDKLGRSDFAEILA